MTKSAWMGAFASLLVMPAVQQAQSPKPSVMLTALQAELTRSLQHFKSLPTPPYFLSYEVFEDEVSNVSGSFGSLVASGHDRRRVLTIDLRVGSYQLDNTHPVRGGLADYSRFNYPIPIEDDPDAIRALIWHYTDQSYKKAIEDLIAVKTNVKVKAEETDRSGDFSPAKAEKDIRAADNAANFDRKAWEEKVRKYSAPLQRYGNIYSATASLTAESQTRWLVSSDGAMLQTSNRQYRLMVSAFAKASDGMELPLNESFYSSTLQGLPSDDVVLDRVQKMGKSLMALKLAPVMEPYLGPAILSPRASGVFFHELFGHRIEEQDEKREDRGMTFRDKVGQMVLPDFLSVYDDPTLKKFGVTELSGYYDYDDEGVKARRVTVVENGVLKNFLTSRLPMDGFPESNGHGRGAGGHTVLGRQSNLLVVASKTVTPEELRKQLLDEVQKRKLPYGLYFEDIAGGFTYTGRGAPNFFEVVPIMVYRIYPDGREELVRGVNLVGTALTTFSKILGADNRAVAFNLSYAPWRARV